MKRGLKGDGFLNGIEGLVRAMRVFTVLSGRERNDE
jgi:hypothetical protein